MSDERDVIINEYKELVRRQAEEINRLDAKIIKLMEENERLRAALELAKLPPINTPAPSNPPVAQHTSVASGGSEASMVGAALDGCSMHL